VRGPDGHFVCKPDLFDEEAGLVVEYDGEEHRPIRRHASDAGRHERCRDVGLEYCMVTGPDMSDRGGVVARLRSARARAPFTPVEQRRWFVAQDDEESVDDYLDRREAMASELWEQRGIWIPSW